MNCKLLHSQFVRNSGTLLTGNVVAQGVAFLAYLVLCRFFTPEDFALYNIFYSYIEVLIILSTCKYELAIVVADNDDEAARLTRLTLRLNTCVSLLLLTVALVLTLLHLQPSSLPSTLVLLIPFMVFFCGTTRVYTFFYNRYHHYRTIATSEVVTSLSGTFLKILFGLLNGTLQLLHTLGLPVGTILGKVAGNIYMRRHAHVGHASLSRQESRRLMSAHRNFPLYVMPKDFVSSFSANLPFMLLSIYFNDTVIGLFGLALTFTSRPVNILANAFEKVFYASSNEKMAQRQPLLHDILRFMAILNAVALPVAAVGFFYAEPLFTFLFGEKWIGTGYYVRCVIPWLWVLLNANSLMFVANIFSTQRIDFFFQLAQLLLRVTALYIGIQRHNFNLAILLFCAVSTLVQLFQLAWYLHQLRKYEKAIGDW